MEQQLKPQLTQNSLGLDQDEDEEDGDEEVGVGLLARHSRHPINGVGTTPTTSTIATASGELGPAPAPASAPTNGITSDNSVQEEKEEEDEATAGDENEKGKVFKGEGDGIGNSIYFDKLQGTKSINGISEIPKILSMETNHQQVKNVEDQNFFGVRPALVEQLHGETNKSSKHLDNAAKVDSNVDLIREIEEDLTEVDVERVLEKQNTHDLYCPNCNSCITRKVILVRRKPKISNIRQKPKHVRKSDPIPNSPGDGCSGDTPEIHANVSPTLASDEQNNGREQEQEAFSCLSCFSLFIPIGNGCFKIFQFFKPGRQNEHTQNPQEINQRDNTQSTQGINPSEIAQSPQEISWKESTETPQKFSDNEDTQSTQGINPSENAQSPQEVSQKENTQTPQKFSDNEDIQSTQGLNLSENTKSPQEISQRENTETPQKFSDNEDTQCRSHEENMHRPQHINHNEDAQSPQHISHNESPQKISSKENKQRPQDINQNESKQSPQKIPTAKTNCIFSFFAFHKGTETVEKAGHAALVQNAAIPTQSVTGEDHIDGVAIKPKEPGISNIFSSANSSLLYEVKAESREKKPDADMFQRNAGDNEIEDLEAGLIEPRLHPRTEVTYSPQSRTQNEHLRGTDASAAREWEILKSIVYGGLIESIASAGVVSSAAGAGADTLNVLALGLANVIGGLVIISHNLRELKHDQPRGASTEINIEEDRYYAVLGRRQNFVWHVIVAIASFLIFGLVPPVVYGFSFRKSDDKDLKLAAMAGASLACIVLLALGKGHVRKPHRTYFRTVSYYVILGILAAGISYLVGELIKKLAEQLRLFESSSAVSVPFLDSIPFEVGRASY